MARELRVVLGEPRDLTASFVDADAIMMGQISMFDSSSFATDSAGRIGLVETYAPSQIVQFSNLELITDSRGKLILQGMIPSPALERPANFTNPSMPHVVANVDSPCRPGGGGQRH